MVKCYLLMHIIKHEIKENVSYSSEFVLKSSNRSGMSSVGEVVGA